MSNSRFIQLSGPFKDREELVNRIKNFNGIKHIGIQAKEDHGVYLNGQFFKIGKTQILQLDEIKIESIYFAQDEDTSTLIDCILN